MMRTRSPADAVRRAIERRSFCTLATSSNANQPHVVGVAYVYLDDRLYLTTLEGSKKARNIRGNPRVAVCVPVRRFPVGPPFVVQFGGVASILSLADAVIADLVDRRELNRITSHGELDDPRTCFVQVTPDRKVSTYGIGVSLRTLLRDPISGSRSFDLGG